MDDSIRTAKYTPLNYQYSRVCLVCGETERYSSPTTATIVDTSLPWLCDRCRNTLLKLIEDTNTSNALNALDCVEERKTGEWVKNEGRVGWHCSICGVDNNYAYSWDNNIGRNEFQDNYCPNCGAKMERKE